MHKDINYLYIKFNCKRINMKKTNLLKLCGIASIALGTQLAVANTSAPMADPVNNSTASDTKTHSKAHDAKCSAEHRKASNGKCGAGHKKANDNCCSKHKKAKVKAKTDAKKAENKGNASQPEATPTAQ